MCCRTSACSSSARPPQPGRGDAGRRPALQLRIMLHACSVVCAWMRGARTGDGAIQRRIATQCEALGDTPYTTRSRRRGLTSARLALTCATPTACWRTTCPSAPPPPPHCLATNCKPGALDQFRSPVRPTASGNHARLGLRGRSNRRRLRSAVCMTSGGNGQDSPWVWQ